MTISQLQEIRGYLEESFDDFAAYLTKGAIVETQITEIEAQERAQQIIEALGDAIDFGQELTEMEEEAF